MVITANAAVGKSWATHATGILAGLTAGGGFLVGALDLGGAGLVQAGPGGQQRALDVGIMATAAVAAVLAARPVRERIARVLPIDPDSPVHAYALVLAVFMFGTQLATVLFVDVLAIDQSLPSLSIWDVLASETPFLIMALAGVGLYIRRNAGSATLRLGLVRPSWSRRWQLRAPSSPLSRARTGSATNGHPESPARWTGRPSMLSAA
jgi:hypothetical protein